MRDQGCRIIHQQMAQDPWLQQQDHTEVKNEQDVSSSTYTSSIGEESSNGSSSISSLDTTDDASSSSLYDLSEIMSHLPIKRGLSKFYEGKSESFTSLARVTSTEDLAKKTTPYRRNLKASKSCGSGLNSYKPYTLPKAVISKKATTRVSSFSSFPAKRGSFVMISSKPPTIPLHRNL